MWQAGKDAQMAIWVQGLPLSLQEKLTERGTPQWTARELRYGCNHSFKKYFVKCGADRDSVTPLVCSTTIDECP